MTVGEEVHGQALREEKLSFEEAFARLEAVVAKLESGEAGLEEALELFEEGVTLSRYCRQKLDEAEGRIRVLVEGADGEAHEAEAPELEAGLFGEAGDAP